jgi:hypothetical protein
MPSCSFTPLHHLSLRTVTTDLNSATQRERRPWASKVQVIFAVMRMFHSNTFDCLEQHNTVSIDLSEAYNDLRQ